MKSMEFVHFGIIYPSIVVRLYLGFFNAYTGGSRKWNGIYYFSLTAYCWG